MRPPGPTGHRRAHVRFEVMGMMAAAIQAAEPLKVLNLGISGALVETSLPLTPNTEHRMQLVIEGHVNEVTVKVRRVTAVTDDPATVRYHIGLEFLSIPAEAEDAIQQIVVASQAQV